MVKQTLEEFIEAYRMKCSGPVQDLWDAEDDKYVASLFAPEREEDDDRDRDSN
jgi:hypothetical protein